MSEYAQLHAVDVSFAYGPRVILHRVSLTLTAHDRVGIVGPNGSGKSTLLRLLTGELEPEAGTIATNPPQATVGLLRQQLAEQPGESIRDFILRRTGVGEIVAEFESSLEAIASGHPGADDRYDRALRRYVAVDAATMPTRSERALAEVGLEGIDPERLTIELSGGQRTKLNLAAMLLASFDVLLLDEPTNDLDERGLTLLEDMVLSQARPLMVVSHDRAFLERVATSVLELDDHTHEAKRFNGGFTAWQHAREVARLHHQQAYDEYTSKHASLQQRARQQKQWSNAGVGRAKKDTTEPDKNIRAHRIETSENLAGKAKQTERALERLDRDEKVEAPWKPWDLRLEFAPAERSGDDVAELRSVTVRRGDFVLGPITAAVHAGDRILITGKNGSGKTTLLNALLGEVDIASGDRRIGPSVRFATLRQGRDLFPEAPTLLRGFIDASGCDDQAARSQLAKLGLDVHRIDRPVDALSPGERTRAALGLFAALGSNVLILDEPTNHLDLPAIDELETALAAFPHTVLLVSHDRRLIENVQNNRVWHLDRGHLEER